MHLLKILINILAGIFYILGIITTIIAVYDLYEKWLEKINKLRRKKAIINDEYFIAHIIHLGGDFSTTYSLQVFSNEEGGYYFNPPKEFINISFNRGGDFMVITMPDIVQRSGFVIDSIGDNYDNLGKSKYPDICHLPINSLKNEYFVKFIKLKHKTV